MPSSRHGWVGMLVDGTYEDAESNWFNVSSEQALGIGTNLKAVSSIAT